jgi:PAS domain S-box-containing protein
MSVVDDYLRWCAEINSGAVAKTWTAELKDGRTIHVCHRRMPDGGWVATHDDITELKPRRAVANELFSLQALIDFVPDYLWVKDTESRFLVANKALTIDNGRRSTNEVIGLSDFDFHAPEIASVFRADEQEIMRSGQPLIDKEECVLDAKGITKWLLSTKVPLRDERGEIFGLVGIARDITERKRADAWRNGQAQILEMIALSAELGDVLDHLMRLVESQLTGIFGSVLLLDEDCHHLRHGAAPSLHAAYTKAIDGVRIGPKVGSCGTAVYRREPVIVTDILSDPLWEDYRELVAVYGYRSCWSTPILSPQGTVLGVFAMYSMSVREPTPVETRLIDLTTHIAGIAIERKRAEDQIRFLAHHDVLTGLPNRSLLKDRLTQAILQTQRYNPWVSVVFIDLDNFKTINDSLGHTAGDELLKVVANRMTGCVRATDTVVRLGGDEFVILLIDQLLYQPQVDLRTGRVFAVEALVRWQHPTFGMLSPLKFIPMAEETGLIVPLGDWVLHEACRQNRAWQNAGLPPMNVCVNVSARQFREKTLISRVVNALHESGMDARHLELEITESLIMQDVDQSVATMEELQRLGVKLAIDDFGTGYSSLNALKTFPVARLKIDKSFISNLATNDSDRAVAGAVISLGQKLNLRVIAEGVETAEQVEFLRANNCDEIQGYYFSKPITSAAIADLLKP